MKRVASTSDVLEVTKPGEYASYAIPIANDLNGGEIFFPIHVFLGTGDGPTLSLFSGVHGNDWGTVEIMRRLITQVDPKALRGNLIVVPVANPVALGTLTRNTPDESDNSDLNRIFPGGDGTFTAIFAKHIVDILKRSNHFIDYHSNGWVTSYHSVSSPDGSPDDSSVRIGNSIARAYGCKLLHPKKPDAKTLSGFAQSNLGLSGITVHIGGMGFDAEVEDNWMEFNVRGVLNVMRSVGILDGEADLLDEYWIHKGRWRVFPTSSGLLRTHVGPERLLTKVERGELLGELISPYSLQVVEELRAPATGYLGYVSRMSMVRPGATAFGIVDVTAVNSDGTPKASSISNVNATKA